jgi:hypothetical protein
VVDGLVVGLLCVDPLQVISSRPRAPRGVRKDRKGVGCSDHGEGGRPRGCGHGVAICGWKVAPISVGRAREPCALLSEILGAGRAAAQKPGGRWGALGGVGVCHSIVWS